MPFPLWGAASHPPGASHRAGDTAHQDRDGSRRRSRALVDLLPRSQPPAGPKAEGV